MLYPLKLMHEDFTMSAKDKDSTSTDSSTKEYGKITESFMAGRSADKFMVYISTYSTTPEGRHCTVSKVDPLDQAIQVVGEFAVESDGAWGSSKY